MEGMTAQERKGGEECEYWGVWMDAGGVRGRQTPGRGRGSRWVRRGGCKVRLKGLQRGEEREGCCRIRGGRNAGEKKEWRGFRVWKG
eukprot:3030822-Rhodomonas_salina.2